MFLIQVGIFFLSREKITLTGNILETQNCRYNPCHNPTGNEACVLHVVNVLANESLHGPDTSKSALC